LKEHVKNKCVKDSYLLHMLERACQKKCVKDACPKKVCHMPTRHVKKERGREKR
jgi:hypothetical protein